MALRAFLRSLKRSALDAASSRASDAAFDVAFYRTHYGDLASLDDEAATLHWLRHGQMEGRLPNRAALVSTHRNFERLPDDFRPLSYLLHNRDLDRRYRDPIAATKHFLDYGLAEGRRYAAAYTDDAFVSAFRARFGVPELTSDLRITWKPLNVEEYLFLRGFDSAAFLRNFDGGFYADIAGLPRTATPFDAIFHFAETGVAALLPIAEDRVFDPAFVRRNLPLFPTRPDPLETDVDLYRHWLSSEAFDLVPANQIDRMKQRFGVTCASEGLLDLTAYRYANDDLKHLDDDALLEHVLRDGLVERRSSVKITLANLPFFLQYAGRLEQGGKKSKLKRAEAIYRRLVHFAPMAPHLNQQFGDFLFRADRFAEAVDHYRRNIIATVASRWCFLNGASCCESLGDLGGAVDALAAGRRKYPDDLLILERWRITSDRFFSDERGFARALAMAGRVEEAQARLYAAALRCHEAAESAAPARPIRTVAIVANTDLPQCTLYRVEQKAEQLALAGFEPRVYDWHRDLASFTREMAECDAVIFYRVAAFPSMARVMEAARAAGLVTFYEIDDLIFDAAAFPEPLEDYAGQISRTEHVELCLGVPLFRRALELCDFAIASTPALAARMEPLVRSRKAFVHRNALGARHERAVARAERRPEPGDRITIFYGSGTKAHKRDFERILLPALERLQTRFGDKVRFVFAGHRPVGTTSGVLAKAVVLPFTADVEAYWAALSEADICLSVLRPSPGNDAKSEIKWLEAAMFGLPAVVSRTASFDAVLSDGVDGCLASDAEAFYEALAELLADADKRRSIGRAALAKARRDYASAVLARNLGAIFAAVVPPTVRRTRVLVVNVFYPPQAKGGATRVVVDNISDLRRLYPDGFEFEVFTTREGADDPYVLDVYASEGVRVTAMATRHYAGIDLAPTDARAMDCFRRCVERFAPDLIHFHCIQRITASAAQVARDFSIPYLVTVHDGWWISDSQFLHDGDGTAPIYAYGEPPLHVPFGSGKSSYSRPARLRPLLDGAEAVLAVSEPFADIYRRAGIAKVRTIANGVPDFAPGPASVSPRTVRDKIRIAHLGGLEAHKGLPLLKRAILVARPKNVTALIVDLAMDGGDERVENWAGTPVRVIARQPQADMAAVYADIDILFAPSLWPESYGLVTREAANAGCWVVASDRGAVAEPIEEGVNGHVVSVDDASALVALLRRIDADPKRYTTPPASRPVLRRSQDQAADLAELYRSITEGARSEAERLAAE